MIIENNNNKSPTKAGIALPSLSRNIIHVKLKYMLRLSNFGNQDKS